MSCQSENVCIFLFGKMVSFVLWAVYGQQRTIIFTPFRIKKHVHLRLGHYVYSVRSIVYCWGLVRYRRQGQSNAVVTSNGNGDNRLVRHHLHCMVGCHCKFSRVPCTDIWVAELSGGIVAERALF